MAMDNEVQYRLKFTCDGCGAEESHVSAWELLGNASNAHLPRGWAHFHGISVLQIDDVCRNGRDLDFCHACLTEKSLLFLIEKIPFDDRSLKATIFASGRGTRPHGSGD